jgi:hypothetical protein
VKFGRASAQTLYPVKIRMEKQKGH